MLVSEPQRPQAGEEILSAIQVARELRCSKAHVYKVIQGKVEGVSCLPSRRASREGTGLTDSQTPRSRPANCTVLTRQPDSPAGPIKVVWRSALAAWVVSTAGSAQLFFFRLAERPRLQGRSIFPMPVTISLLSW